MGLHAQLGTDGPNATCFCLFCRGKLTKEDCTTLPGWPQLPDVPADWALPRALRNKARTYVGRHHPYARFDPRGAAAKPEPRSLAGMRTQAAGYKAACELARKGESAQVTSTAKWESNKHGPLWEGGMPLISLVGPMTLHLDLGIGKQLHDKLQEKCEAFDKQVAAHGGDVMCELHSRIVAMTAEKDGLDAEVASAPYRSLALPHPRCPVS